MPAMITVNLDRPLKAATICSNPVGQTRASVSRQVSTSEPVSDAGLNTELEAQISQYRDACQALQGVIAQLSRFHEELFSGHNEAIAQLSVEIARKVLMRNIAEGDYKIESIVREALKNAPSTDDIVIRLNPSDLAECRNAQEADDSVLSGLELLADPDIGRGECILESPKGIIKSLIDEHLERIGKALEKTE